MLLQVLVTVPFSRACSVKLEKTVFRISSGEEIHSPSLHAPERKYEVNWQEEQKSQSDHNNIIHILEHANSLFQATVTLIQGNFGCNNLQLSTIEKGN